jgi:hypothetical protein
MTSDEKRQLFDRRPEPLTQGQERPQQGLVYYLATFRGIVEDWAVQGVTPIHET